MPFSYYLNLVFVLEYIYFTLAVSDKSYIAQNNTIIIIVLSPVIPVEQYAGRAINTWQYVNAFEHPAIFFSSKKCYRMMIIIIVIIIVIIIIIIIMVVIISCTSLDSMQAKAGQGQGGGNEG